MQCLGGSPGHCTSQHRPAPGLHMLSFEIFVKSMPPSLEELKVTPSFCFAFKIPDDVAASSTYLDNEAMQTKEKCTHWFQIGCRGWGWSGQRPESSVRPKPGFDIGNRIQSLISVSVLELIWFFQNRNIFSKFSHFFPLLVGMQVFINLKIYPDLQK